jgi:assimilatory nitrate reductase catalytic subunit
LDAKTLGQSLLMPVSKPPVEIKPKGKVICNCFNVSADTMTQCLSKMPAGTSPDQAMNSLQSETQCGTNCGSCKPEVKQIIASCLKKMEVAA